MFLWDMIANRDPGSDIGMRRLFSNPLAPTMSFSLAACSSSSQTNARSEASQQMAGANYARGKPTRGFPSNGSGGPRPGGPPQEGPGGNVDTSSIRTKYMNIAYGNLDPSFQIMDVYLPNEGKGPFPVVAYVHGGGFHSVGGSVTGVNFAPVLESLDHGHAVVSINYRGSDQAKFPAAVSDCKAAIRFIRANAGKYNLNADHIAAWGESAGGNLVSMLGTTGNVDTLNGDNKENLQFSSAVQAVVDWFGPLEFLKMDEQFAAAGVTPVMGKTSSESSPETQYLGQPMTMDPQLTKSAGPAYYVSAMHAESAPSFFIEHGTLDRLIPVQQSIDFAEGLRDAIGKSKVQLVLLEGAGHGTSEFFEQENVDRVMAFLKSVLR
jgi:acetyl esterase/lipase